jgi:hypothetical protein
MNWFIKLILTLLATFFGLVMIPLMFVFAALGSIYFSFEIIRYYFSICNDIIFGVDNKEENVVQEENVEVKD